MSDNSVPKMMSPKYLEARESLPEELHAVYDQLVGEYSFLTEVKYGRGYVAYSVLAELVRRGWRPPDTSEEVTEK